MIRLVLNRRPSGKNPNYCDVCETFVRTHPGGAEVEISMLFADVRGSTALAERMRPTEFSRLMNRFFERANHALRSTPHTAELPLDITERDPRSAGRRHGKPKEIDRFSE